ncbi:MAG: dUTP diphosphatase [Spirochaetaceae bacterium]|jgi:dUTP pyrophosphatase|nr:dUTP diphosphatase [Spirochaetaceae bacterium]
MAEPDLVVPVYKQSPQVRLPQYETPAASGMDLRAFLREAVCISPLERVRIPTGLVFEIPSGYEGQVRPRSGLAWRQGVTVLNAPGTIDSDYRGPVEIILINLGSEPFTIHPGDRIAQLVIAPVSRAVLREADAVKASVRGEGGFGSTGV